MKLLNRPRFPGNRVRTFLTTRMGSRLRCQIRYWIRAQAEAGLPVRLADQQPQEARQRLEQAEGEHLQQARRRDVP